MPTPLQIVELLIAFFAFTVTGAVAWRVSKGGAGTAVTELSTANKVLEQRIHDLRDEYERKLDQLGAEVRDLRVENAELRSRTDYQAVIAEHERRASERHDKTLDVLMRIAENLAQPS